MESVVGQDISGNTATAIGTGLTALFPAFIAIAWPSPRPQWLVWGGHGVAIGTAAGDGYVGVFPRETTGGSQVALVGCPIRGAQGGFKIGTFSSLVDLQHGEFRLGVVTTTRIFRLYGQLFRDSGTWTAAARGGSTTVRAFIRTEYR